MTSFRMALDSIWNKKGRSFLTMLGIIIGVTAVLVLVAMVSGYNADITAYYEKMGVNKVNITVTWKDKSRARDMTAELDEFTKASLSDKVSGVTPVLTASGTVTFGENRTDTTSVYLVNEQYQVCGNYVIDKGRDITTYDIENRNNICVIGSYVADTLFQYSNPIGEKLLINGGAYTVVGTYYQKDGSSESSMDDMLILPYTLKRSFLTTDYITEYTVKVEKAAYMDSVIAAIETYYEENLSDSVGSYKVENGNSAMSESQDEITSLSVVLGGIACISLLVGGIGIMNIMLVTVSERTREIGIRKSIGAPPIEIISQFIVEAGILSALGGIIGVILGYALSAILAKAMYDLIVFPSILITVGAFAFAVIIGMVFGLYPAAKAASLQPVDALRAE